VELARIQALVLRVALNAHQELSLLLLAILFVPIVPWEHIPRLLVVTVLLHVPDACQALLPTRSELTPQAPVSLVALAFTLEDLVTISAILVLRTPTILGLVLKVVRFASSLRLLLLNLPRAICPHLLYLLALKSLSISRFQLLLRLLLPRRLTHP